MSNLACTPHLYYAPIILLSIWYGKKGCYFSILFSLTLILVSIISGMYIPLSISIGVATKEKSSQNIQSVIRKADGNMYRNKLLEKDSLTYSIISSLGMSLFEKSHETSKHTDRLKKMAIKLGRASSLAENKLDKLALLSKIHDIGKVAIPEEILQKKEKLTRSEWDTIKRHSVIGSNICE